MSATRPLVALVDPSDARWEGCLATMPHDVYQTPGYMAFAAQGQLVGEPLAVIVEMDRDKLLVPLILRTIPADVGGDGVLCDAVSPRGYPGPLLKVPSGESERFLEEAIRAVKDALRDRHVVSAFIRLHPLFDLPLPALAAHGDLVDHGDSVSIDLRLSEEDLWGRTRTNHRRDINAAIRGGLVARIDEDWSRFDDFVAAFDESMQRLDSAPWWRLGPDYFVGLRRALGDRLHLCVVEDGDHVAAAALLTEVDGIVEYHLSGTFDSYIAASPSKLIIHFATRWAKGRGDHVLHLAGSLRRGDPLIRFKLGFSPTTHVVRSWRVVVDEGAYAGLMAARGRGSEPDEDANDEFFPAYRRPLSEVGPSSEGEREHS